jgi:NADH:ubiquinone oxidoreductase subunit 4 (subunit M)
VEASVSGSMILAGVLLKLGGYGLLQVFCFLSNFYVFKFIWVSISLVDGVVVRLICLRQTDLKSLVAYSSDSYGYCCRWYYDFELLRILWFFCSDNCSWVMFFWFILSY